MLCHLYVLGDLRRRGTKLEVAAAALPSWGPKRGRKCYVIPAFSGISDEVEQNQKSLPHPCLLGGPKQGGNTTSPLHSQGSPSKGNNIRSGCLTLAFLAFCWGPPRMQG